MTNITAIIPTYNRAEVLKDTLDCLLQQETTEGFDYEIIVIDNNSSDNTKAVVHSYIPRFKGRLQYLFEPTQGRTFALNTGIKGSSGAIITCIDDDCFLEKDHLLKIFRIFNQVGPDVGFLGGKIHPHWLKSPYPQWLDEFLPQQPLRQYNPDWFNEFFCGPLGILDYGDKPFIIDYNLANHDQRHFYGANISFRKELFEKYGYFSEKSILVEDTEMCIRLFKAGIRARYSPELKVFHKINASAISNEYYYKWYFTKGLRREILEHYIVKVYHPFGIQISFIKRTARLARQSFIAKSFKQQLYLRCQALFNLGQMLKIFKENMVKRVEKYENANFVKNSILAKNRLNRISEKTPSFLLQQNKVLISVVICTRNRVDSLKDILECLCDQNINSHFDYDVLVVDNNSQDNTKGLVESYIPQFKTAQLRYLWEPRQGKPYALNRGIQVAQGDLLVTTDDDCLMGKNYLENIYRTFRNSQYEVGFIGGKILPYWIGSEKPRWLEEIFLQPSKLADDKPNWFKLFFEGPLGILDYGNEAFTIDFSEQKHGTRLFYGANMAFQKELFQKFGNYRLDKTLTQDTEICQRLLRSGVRGLYVPEMKVAHKIKTNRVTPQYYYRWYFLRGQYLESEEEYQKKFYHPLGIQFSLIAATIALFSKSLFERSITQRIYSRSKGIFNLGRMIKIAKRNII